jgi:serine/threonine protein kinase
MAAFDTSQSAYQDLRYILKERTQPVTAWVGAGLSREAGLPSWGQLRDALCAELEKKLTSVPDTSAQAKLDIARRTDDFWLAFDLLRVSLGRATYRDAVRAYLRDLDQALVPQSYKYLWRLGVKGILTLNLDRLAARAYSESGNRRPLTTFTGLRAGQYVHLLKAQQRFLVNVHGVIDEYESWVLTKPDLTDLLATRGYRAFIETVLNAHTVVFIGMSVDDLAVGGHLRRLMKSGVDSGSHYWFSDRRDGATDVWAESAGIRAIRYTAARDDHSALQEAFKDLCSYVPEDKEAEPVVPEFAVQAEELALPSPEELRRSPPEACRQALNREAARLLAPRTREAYQTYQAFSETYDSAIYHAWYHTLRPPDNVVLGYTLLERVGGGAFGRVFKAQGPAGEIVAIKILREEMRAQEGMLEAFRRGVASMRILSEARVDGMVPYRAAYEIPACAIMEFIEGPDLAQAVQRDYLSTWTEVLEVALGVVRIIRQAHRLPQRVLHRDIRPQNIMLKGYWEHPEAPRVVVLDFDLSWHRDAVERSIANPQSPIGFLAPELLEHRAGVSTRSAAVDSYGLGMTIFFMCGKKEPQFAQHRHADWVKTVSELVERRACAPWRSLPRRIARLIINATKDDQNERIDVAEIEGELTRLMEAEAKPLEVASAELLAEELAARANRGYDYDWDDERGAAEVKMAGGVLLRLIASERERLVRVEASWTRSGAEAHQRVEKWAPAAIDRVRAALEGGGWEDINPQRAPGSLRVSCSKRVVALAAALDDASACIEKVCDELRFVV